MNVNRWNPAKLHKRKAPKKGKENETRGQGSQSQGKQTAQVEHVLVANKSKEVGHKDAREPLSINT
jgi:hypothetical protein